MTKCDYIPHKNIKAHLSRGSLRAHCLHFYWNPHIPDSEHWCKGQWGWISRTLVKPQGGLWAGINWKSPSLGALRRRASHFIVWHLPSAGSFSRPQYQPCDLLCSILEHKAMEAGNGLSVPCCMLKAQPRSRCMHELAWRTPCPSPCPAISVLLYSPLLPSGVSPFHHTPHLRSSHS